MRFDIRSGGIAGILVGILLLSGAVFVMGLLAGYDIGHQSQIAVQQVTEQYPLPEAPAAAPTPAAPIIAASTPVAPVAPRPHEAAAKKQLASAPAPRVRPEAADAAAGDVPDLGEDPSDAQPEVSPTPPQVAAVASPAAPSATHRKPFSIQIQAAMDAASADDMMKRLEDLGYPAHMTPAQLNGATWYKVTVGPFATREEATAAEAELRRKYDSAYGGTGTSAAPAANSSPLESSSQPDEE